LFQAVLKENEKVLERKKQQKQQERELDERLFRIQMEMAERQASTPLTSRCCSSEWKAGEREGAEGA